MICVLIKHFFTLQKKLVTAVQKEKEKMKNIKKRGKKRSHKAKAKADVPPKKSRLTSSSESSDGTENPLPTTTKPLTLRVEPKQDLTRTIFQFSAPWIGLKSSKLQRKGKLKLGGSSKLPWNELRPCRKPRSWHTREGRERIRYYMQ